MLTDRWLPWFVTAGILLTTLLVALAAWQASPHSGL